MGEHEDRVLFRELTLAGFPLRDRRLVASEEYFTMGDPSRPTVTREHGRARHIYGEGTPAGDLSRDWQATDIERRRALPDEGRPARMPYSPVSATGGRTLASIHAAILHQTTFNVPALADVPAPPPGDERALRRYVERTDHRVDHIIAHFVVLRDGTIAYLRDVTHALNSVSYSGGIDIEFEGRYPHDATPPTDGDRRAPVPMIRAGRALVQALRAAFGVGCVVTHGQVQADPEKLDSCPGPDIWVNVGMWCANNASFSTDASAVFRNDNGFGTQNNPAYDQHV